MSEPRPGDVASLSIDLSALVRRSVATLYSHLVTRPTGRALRVGIESQLEELGGPALSILDFRQVVILDYSCADETVAKLLCHFREDDRPADIYFLASGVGERHREPIEEVLLRHGLALVAQLDEGDVVLLGDASDLQRSVWAALESLGRADAAQLAGALGLPQDAIATALAELARRRVAVPLPGGRCVALSALLTADPGTRRREDTRIDPA